MPENKNGLMEEVKKIILRERGEHFLHEFLEETEAKQKMAFLDGYKYAIRVLEDGLTESEKNEVG
ncbi:MAG: hypothetical protein SO016_09510 [Lachnospiraceae bacterium]|nr:hypothetical protein [Robinsoniella sp.]MDY3766908.1 hypothetical protein [Lachnospiraceae bacterium]